MWTTSPRASTILRCLLEPVNSSMVVEVTGNSDKIDAFEKLLESFGIIERVRSGKVVIARGTGIT